MLQPKPLFAERMSKLLPDKKDFQTYLEIIHKEPVNSIRCNTLKITPEKLKKKLEEKGWKIKQSFKQYPEIMIIENELQPGELGKAMEHLLGYYYVQEISSMLSILALNPKPGESFLDLCASPGSKTGQAAAMMENKGFVLANDKTLDRIIILNTNLERMGVMNQIITQADAIVLCERLERLGMKFDKILVDAPCSGEGTMRSSSGTFTMWNINMVKKLSRLQKRMLEGALKILKDDGELVYSTCTHSPEENEEVIQNAIDKFNVKIEKINLPLKCRQGINEWQNEKFSSEINRACRIYPQDNDTEGFFLCKIKLR